MNNWGLLRRLAEAAARHAVRVKVAADAPPAERPQPQPAWLPDKFNTDPRLARRFITDAHELLGPQLGSLFSYDYLTWRMADSAGKPDVPRLPPEKTLNELKRMGFLVPPKVPPLVIWSAASPIQPRDLDRIPIPIGGPRAATLRKFYWSTLVNAAQAQALQKHQQALRQLDRIFDYNRRLIGFLPYRELPSRLPVYPNLGRAARTPVPLGFGTGISMTIPLGKLVNDAWVQRMQEIREASDWNTIADEINRSRLYKFRKDLEERGIDLGEQRPKLIDGGND